MKFFRISKWEKYQHYHKPRPAWLKIYTTINDSGTDWRDLSDPELGQLLRLMVFASMTENTIPFDHKYVRALIGATHPINLKRLEELGVIQVFETRAECTSRETSRVLERKRSRVKTPSLDQRSEIRDQSSEIRGQSKNKIKSGKPDKPPIAEIKKNAKKLKDQAKEVLDHLNARTGRRFTLTRDIEKCLKREKCSVDDCKKVIDFKHAEWTGTDMERFLTPVTLWRPKHFVAYLDEANAGKVGKSRDSGKVDEFGNPIPQWELDVQKQMAEMDRKKGEGNE